MSTQYIHPTHEQIGDYKIIDPVFGTSILDSTIEQLKSISADFDNKINNNINDIHDLFLSVDDLYLSARDTYLSVKYIPQLAISVVNAVDIVNENALCVTNVVGKINDHETAIEYLNQAIETQVVTVEYTNTPDQITPGYRVQPYQCSILKNFSTNPKNIILQNYSEGKTYKLKFTVGDADLMVGDSASTILISFSANDGTEKVAELNASNVVFSANTTYLISLSLGMIQVIAKV